MVVKSKALEVNLESYHVDTEIDPKYSLLKDVMSKYYGLSEAVTTFLKELSHPYKNWSFIVQEARNYSLNYFYVIQSHAEGPRAALLYFDIFQQAILSAKDAGTRADACDDVLLFLQKIINESGNDFSKFKPVLDNAFEAIAAQDNKSFDLTAKSYYQVKKIGQNLLDAMGDESSGFESINRLLIKYFHHTYDYWLKEDDPRKWFEKEARNVEDPGIVIPIFKDISHEKIKEMSASLEKIEDECKLDSAPTTRQLVKLFGHTHFVTSYRATPQKLFKAGNESSKGKRWKLFFLFRIMNIAGLSLIHEESLRDINRTLTWLISNEDQNKVRKLISQTFSILKKRANDFPATALNCVLNMGQGVYKTDDNDFVNFFTDFIIDLGFQAPMISGVSNDWQIIVNHDHLQNVTTWLRLIQLKPQWSSRLLSALIINLSLSGIFIKDTDLFPREITRFLNSDIEPVYNLCKQLARLFPAFFNDIGAEGELREVSTRIDEISHRKDILIHFLRKQCHVESSSQVVKFIEAVLEFWRTGEKTILMPFVPPSIYRHIETRGKYFDGVHEVMTFLESKGISSPGDMLKASNRELREELENFGKDSKIHKERVIMAKSLYQLLFQKYNLNFIELDHYITTLGKEAFTELNELKKVLQLENMKSKIGGLLDYLGKLKDIILSTKEYEIREDIYQKRHITVDIPSMYGTYHEMKFDALGLTFRVESLLNVLFEELVESIDLTLITKATFFQIYNRLKLFGKALELDGISSGEFKRQMEFLSHALNTKGFSYTQYLDVFKGFTLAVKNIINDHFNNIHEQNLNRILENLPMERLLNKYLPENEETDEEKLKHRISEIFFREKLAMSLGLPQLDRFLGKVLNILFKQAEKLSRENLLLLLNYDPHRAMSFVDNDKKDLESIILLGNKGFNLLKLNSFGLPIPPGFIITTEVFRCRKIIESYGPAEEIFRQHVASQMKKLEKVSGKSFGNPSNPLILSVRSGSAISQPGMMDTLLNVGMNEDIAEGIAVKTGNSWFAWDNYRRFLQCYGMAYNLKRDDFDAIIGEFKNKLGIPLKSGFTGDQMKKIALAYKKMIIDNAVEVESNPFEQLLICIKKVFESWESEKARTYRQIMGISDDWGTAATVQSMVFGNLSPSSGTGVLFTHSPRLSGDSLRLWGDFTVGNQGEDVVSGLVRTLPISNVQQNIEQRETDITLESQFPEIYNTMKKYVYHLVYDRGWSPQEMEFTFEGPRGENLFILQTRDMAMRERKKVFVFVLEDVLTNEYFLGHGIGVSGGALSGRIVFTLDEIENWRKKEPEETLILVRGDTVPDDILEIFASDGILTARGGLTSHAAVVAHRLEKTCVVGCRNLVCDEKNKSAEFNGMVLKSGDFISIDGQQGAVFKGKMRVKEE